MTRGAPERDEGDESWFFLEPESFLMFNGAAQSSLNGGLVETIILRKVAPNPAAQAKVLANLRLLSKVFDPNKPLNFRFFLAHETLTQTLDLDFDYVVVNDGDNVNTKAAGVTQTNAPVTPGTAYDEFYTDYVIAAAELTDYFMVSFKLTRQTGGAETGDLHLVKVGIYQD